MLLWRRGGLGRLFWGGLSAKELSSETDGGSFEMERTAGRASSFQRGGEGDASLNVHSRLLVVHCRSLPHLVATEILKGRR